MGLRVLLVGGGVREHAIAENVIGHGHSLYSVTSKPNVGLGRVARATKVVSLSAASEIAGFAKRVKADVAIIGPELPLHAGVSDALTAAGVPTFAPSREQAKLEWSKIYAMQLALKHGIPGAPDFEVIENFRSLSKLKGFHERFGNGFVIKADGLMSGKGVFVGGDHFNSLAQARKIAAELLKRGSVVLQQKLEGIEFSGHYLAGKAAGFVECPYTQDHKRALEGDEGPNTGGMGSYSDADHSLPFLTRRDLIEAQSIAKSALEAIHKETGRPFTGVLYPAFMKTKAGVKWLEFNCRFGDPEGANILATLSSDFAKAALDAVEGRQFHLKFDKVATVVRYAVPRGYPDRPKVGDVLSVDESKLSKSAVVHYGDAELVSSKGGLTKVSTRASRTLAIVSKGGSLSQAKERADEAFKHVRGKHHRRDDVPDLKKLLELSGR